MSNLDNAMFKHMEYIVYEEGRPFSFKDFLSFEVEGNSYKMGPGTCRNKISKLRKDQKVELAFNSGIAFYTLKGIFFNKSMTPIPTGVLTTNNPIFKLIESLPLDKASLHNIRLKFPVKGLWSLLHTNNYFHIQKDNLSIPLPTEQIDGLLIRVIVHKSDTVELMIACTLSPIASDIQGLINLSNALTRVEERLHLLVQTCHKAMDKPVPLPVIPHHNSWLIVQWHFGKDSLDTYSGEMFSIKFKEGIGGLISAYSKKYPKGKTRIRIERQELPQKNIVQLIEERLDN